MPYGVSQSEYFKMSSTDKAGLKKRNPALRYKSSGATQPSAGAPAVAEQQQMRQAPSGPMDFNSQLERMKAQQRESKTLDAAAGGSFGDFRTAIQGINTNKQQLAAQQQQLAAQRPAAPTGPQPAAQLGSGTDVGGFDLQTKAGQEALLAQVGGSFGSGPAQPAAQPPAQPAAQPPAAPTGGSTFGNFLNTMQSGSASGPEFQANLTKGLADARAAGDPNITVGNPPPGPPPPPTGGGGPGGPAAPTGPVTTVQDGVTTTVDAGAGTTTTSGGPQRNQGGSDGTGALDPVRVDQTAQANTVTNNQNQVNLANQATATGQTQSDVNPFVDALKPLQDSISGLAANTNLDVNAGLNQMAAKPADTNNPDMMQGFMNTLQQANKPLIDQLNQQRAAQQTFMNDQEARQQAQQQEVEWRNQQERARNSALDFQQENVIRNRMQQFDEEGNPIDDAITQAQLAGAARTQGQAQEQLATKLQGLGVLRNTGAPIDAFGELTGLQGIQNQNIQAQGQTRQENAFRDSLALLNSRRQGFGQERGLADQARRTGVAEGQLGLGALGEFGQTIRGNQRTAMQGLLGMGDRLGTIGGQRTLAGNADARADAALYGADDSGRSTMASRFGTADRSGMLDGMRTMQGGAFDLSRELGRGALSLRDRLGTGALSLREGDLSLRDRLGTADRSGMLDGMRTMQGGAFDDARRWGDQTQDFKTADRTGFLGGQRTLAGIGRDDAERERGRRFSLDRETRGRQLDIDLQRANELNRAGKHDRYKDIGKGVLNLASNIPGLGFLG
jgi:hypothetical protein